LPIPASAGVLLTPCREHHGGSFVEESWPGAEAADVVARKARAAESFHRALSGLPCCRLRRGSAFPPVGLGVLIGFSNPQHLGLHVLHGRYVFCVCHYCREPPALTLACGESYSRPPIAISGRSVGVWCISAVPPAALAAKSLEPVISLDTLHKPQIPNSEQLRHYCQAKLIERHVCRLKEFRRVVTRYDEPR
jgi:hypothetical protein